MSAAATTPTTTTSATIPSASTMRGPSAAGREPFPRPTSCQVAGGLLSSALPLTQRRQYFLFFLLVVSVIAAGFALGRRRPGPSLLDSVPRDAWLVATVDVAAIRASPLAKPFLAAGGGTQLGALGYLTSPCGFDPGQRLREVVITSPENGERGDFGVAFNGEFTKDELAHCADTVIRGRGGSPVPSTRGGYILLEDTSDPQHARVAYREGGPYLVGRGTWVAAMIDAIERKGEGIRSEHTDLRAALLAKEGAAPAVMVTALLPASVRDKLKAELASELGGEGDRGYAGVLAVSAAGAAIGFTGQGGDAGASTTSLSAEMHCDTPAACDEVKKLIER